MQTLFTTLGIKERSIQGTVHFGSETLSHLAPKIWELVPEEIKKLESVASFKNTIKKWKPANCPCRLCRTCIFQVGFVLLLYDTK